MKVSNLKKYAIGGIVAVLLLTATACKGSEAKKVDRLIRDIGTVTVESKESIETAAEAYNELSDEEKDLVTEYEHLQDARKEYRECLLDALENDDLLSQVEATVSATMSNYSPKFTLNREERVLYFEVTSDQDSTDAVLFYPGLSYAFFSVLENKCAIFHLKYMKLHGNMKLIRLLLCMDTILSGETCLKSEMVVL